MTLESIKNLVELHTQVKNIADPSRKRINIDAIKMYVFLSKTYTKESLLRIALAIGRTNHANIKHHHESFQSILNQPTYNFHAEYRKCDEILYLRREMGDDQALKEKVKYLITELGKVVNNLEVTYEEITYEQIA